MRLLSLFSGCGGMDVGFEGGFACLKKSVDAKAHPDWIAEDLGDWVKLAPTRFDTVFANDIRPAAKALWVSYFENRKPDADAIYRLGSVVDLVKRAKAGEGAFPSDVDVVTGGFPCQPFSLSGKRLGFADTKDHLGRAVDVPTAENRGTLYMWMRDVVTLTRPKLFVAENVKGLTNLADAKETIERDFADAAGGGYVVVPARVLRAVEYGVPQTRERVIFFGFRRDALRGEAEAALTSGGVPEEYDPYPAPTHGSAAGRPYVTCADAFVGLDEPELSADESQRRLSRSKYIPTRCQGQTEVDLDAPGPTIRSEHHGNVEYRRLGAEHGGKHAGELAAGLPERRLTVRECARLQTLPDDYRFILPKGPGRAPVAMDAAYKAIGNAVPPVLAYNIAKNLEAKWDAWFA